MNLQSARYRRIFWRKNRRKILITVYLFIFILMILAAFYKHQQLNRPTLVRQKIKTGVVNLTPAPSPRPSHTTGQSKMVEKILLRPQTDEEYIKSLPNGDLVWKTYGHESTYGQNDACKSRGLFNGFGFAQNEFGYQCFSSLHEVASKVSDWFSLHLQYMTVNQALCYYNTGKRLDDCDYAEYTLAL